MSAVSLGVERTWEAMHAAVAREGDVILCTVLIFTHGGTRMERVYSSHPAEYPVGGWKDVATEVSPAWIAATRDSDGVFVAQTVAEIERVFADAALIRALGCGSIVNIPLRRDDGSNWATVNILGPEHGFSSENTAALERIVAATTPGEIAMTDQEGLR